MNTSKKTTTGIRKLVVESTLTEELKWEPTLLVTPYLMLQEDQKSDLLRCFKDPTLLQEFLSIVETAKDETVLFVVIAYGENDELLGWAGFNAWVGQVDAKGIIILCTANAEQDLEDNLKAIIIEKTLQHSKDLFYHETMKDLKIVYCQKNLPILGELLLKYGYEPRPVY